MESEEYIGRVYAGVLGKIIGVYMGRPFEGWTHERIMSRFGEVSTYVNESAGCPLVVTDDDIAGTFTFVRALEDYGYDGDIGPAEIGRTWLNYLIYKRTILWWGGLGNSTEHTAYLRLRSGIEAPASGSAAVNGQTTANQIGAQIFIDGWALVSPGDAAQAARLARAAASVSHDGEAVNAAVVIAVIEAMAFEERDLGALLESALSHIPRDSLIARLLGELRCLRHREPDWKAAREWLDREHGYDRYKGVCHVVPNFGIIALSLLYGDGDFRRSLMIANTSGRDTDCNAGNVGCILGVRNGLSAIEECPDLRVPPGDLLFLSSADGGRCVSDAAREALSPGERSLQDERHARCDAEGRCALSLRAARIPPRVPPASLRSRGRLREAREYPRAASPRGDRRPALGALQGARDILRVGGPTGPRRHPDIHSVRYGVPDQWPTSARPVPRSIPGSNARGATDLSPGQWRAGALQALRLHLWSLGPSVEVVRRAGDGRSRGCGRDFLEGGDRVSGPYLGGRSRSAWRRNHEQGLPHEPRLARRA